MAEITSPLVRQRQHILFYGITSQLHRHVQGRLRLAVGFQVVYFVCDVALLRLLVELRQWRLHGTLRSILLHNYQVGCSALRIIQKLIRLFSVYVYCAINWLGAITALLTLINILRKRRFCRRAPLVLVC